MNVQLWFSKLGKKKRMDSALKIPTWCKWSNLLLVRYFLPHCGCRKSQSWPTTPLVVLLFVCLFIFSTYVGSLFDSHLCLGRGTMPGSLKTALPCARNKRNITCSYMMNRHWQGFTVMYNFQKIIWRRRFSFKKICQYKRWFGTGNFKHKHRCYNFIYTYKI